MSDDGHAVDPRESLRRSRDRQVTFKLPAAIDQRLDALMDRATSSGENTSRREIVAAILLASDQSGDQMSALLRAFRTATVSDALLDHQHKGNVVELRSHKPGPRVAK